MDQRNYGIAVMYHPTGVRVTIPLDLETPTSEEAGRVLLQGVSNLLNAGWLAEMPGTNGEKFEVVTHVARRAHSDDTPIVAFYSDNASLKKKVVHKYLNSQEDVLEFEKATGMSLQSIPLFEGDNFPDRDGSQRSNKYVLKLARPLKLVFSITEKWQKWVDGGKEGNEPQKRELLRYDAYATQPSPTMPPASTGRSETPVGEIKDTGEVFKKNDGNLILKLSQEMNLKPNVISPIMYKYAPEQVTYSKAIALVKEHLKEVA